MIIRSPRISAKARKSLFRDFVLDDTAKNASVRAAVSRMCAQRWFRHYREIIYRSLLRAPRFSGEVEVDIGFFAGRSLKKDADLVRRLAGLPATHIFAVRKKVRKAQLRRQMVFGIMQRGGDVYVHLIKKKDRITLESVVRLVVEPGSIIYSDGEKGLSKLCHDQYKHFPVIHAKGFVDKKGNHINGIENFWHRTRHIMGKSLRGIPRTTLLYHIKEREFRYNHRNDLEKALKSLLKGI